jgi:hypothetical protein
VNLPPLLGQLSRVGAERNAPNWKVAGTIVVDVSLNGNTGTLDLSGTNFLATGVSQPGGQVAGGRCLYDFSCRRGETIDLSAFLTFEADGRAVVNCEALDPAFIVSGPGMQIQTESVTIPNGNRRYLTLSVPFTIAEPGASLDIYRDRTEWFAGGVEPWASGIITGSGTATAYFERIHVKADDIGFYYELRRVVYSFDAPPPSGS